MRAAGSGDSLDWPPSPHAPQVKIVRAKEDGAIYALKSMRKEAMILKNQVRARVRL
jgi:hypothetical protein